VLHRFEGVCFHVHVAVERVFKQCGKTIRKTHKSDKNKENVSLEKMKQWLEEIRKHARSKWFVSLLPLYCCQLILVLTRLNG